MKTNQIGFYEVLRPIITATGERGRRPDGTAFDWHSCRWEVIGFADSMQEAKRKFGGSPVLQLAQFGRAH
jgi:hypothetical protein